MLYGKNMRMLTKEPLRSWRGSVEKQVAVVFGLYETGLGVIRSLGQQGVRVVGIDYKKDIGWYSRYVQPLKCPDPLLKEPEFLDWMDATFSGWKLKPAAFFTSDDFLTACSRNREVLSNYLIFNLSNHNLIECISDKWCQYKIAAKAGVDLPATWPVSRASDLETLSPDFVFPGFIKARDVNSWRRVMGGGVKGVSVQDYGDLREKLLYMIRKKVPVILQEIVAGPDTNHCKYCSYTNLDGQIIAEFTLRKIRQFPVRFGIGSAVESFYDQRLLREGRRLFSGIGFKGIGSAEFKYDDRDGKLKLIELNPRYWQQNYLSTVCDMNFPFLNYLDLVNKSYSPIRSFKSGVKWVNRYKDFESFVTYRKEGSLNFWDWRKSRAGRKTYPDFTWDDPLPVLYEIGFGSKLFKVPRAVYKRLFR